MVVCDVDVDLHVLQVAYLVLLTLTAGSVDGDHNFLPSTERPGMKQCVTL